METLLDLLGPFTVEEMEKFRSDMQAIAESERKAFILSWSVFIR